MPSLKKEPCLKEEGYEIGLRKGYCRKISKSKPRTKTPSHPRTMNLKSYRTHDNGGRPFKVVVDSITRQAKVFLNEVPSSQKKTPVYTTGYNRIWIGEWDDGLKGARTRNKGNSILLEVGINEYVYVGTTISQFVTTKSIVHYVSEVGNNDVPYPYAVDEDGRYYLLGEAVSLVVDAKYEDDPYQFFYSKPKPRSKPLNLKEIVPRQ